MKQTKTSKPPVPKPLPSPPPSTVRCAHCNASFSLPKNLKRHQLHDCPVLKAQPKPVRGRTSKHPQRNPQRNTSQPVAFGSLLDSTYTMKVRHHWKPPMKTPLNQAEKRNVERQAQKYKYKLKERVFVKNRMYENGLDHWYLAIVTNVYSSTGTCDVTSVASSKEGSFEEKKISRANMLPTKLYRELFPVHTNAAVPLTNVASTYAGLRAYDMQFQTVDNFLSKDYHKALLGYTTSRVKDMFLVHPERLSLHAGTGSWSGCGKGSGPLKIHFSRDFKINSTEDFLCGASPRICVGCPPPKGPPRPNKSAKRRKRSPECNGCSNCLGREFTCCVCNKTYKIAAEYAARSGRSSVGENIYHRRIEAFDPFLEWLCDTIEQWLRLPKGTLNHGTMIVYNGGALCVKNWDKDDTCPNHSTSKGDDGCGRILAEHCDSLLNQIVSDMQKLQNANSVKLNTPVACLSAGHTRVLEMKFSSNGQKSGLQTEARNSSHALRSNTLSILPQVDETILLRGGSNTTYGPSKKQPGCFMHAVPHPIKAKELSVGFVFRAVDTACQVRTDKRTIRVPHRQWEELKHARVRYGGSLHSKKERHEKETTSWLNKSPQWSAYIKPTVTEALASWDELVEQ